MNIIEMAEDDIEPLDPTNLMNKHFETLVGWKKHFLKNFLNELELKVSPSFRKNINPPVNAQIQFSSPLLDHTASSNEFFDRSKMNFKKDQPRKLKHTNRLNSANASPQSTIAGTNLLNKKK